MRPSEEIVTALKSGNTARVREMLDRDPALAGAETDEGSLLLTGVYYGAREAVRLIRERRPVLDVFEAAALGEAGHLADLLDSAPQLADTYNQQGMTPLGLAAFLGRTEALAVLLDHGADINRVSRSTVAFVPRNTALHAALAGGSEEAAAMLIERGANINVADSNGQTPLHLAAFGGLDRSLDLLLECGAQTEVRDAQGRTPLQIAQEKGHRAAAERLAAAAGR
ncbi:MAG: ankyrin repeat domain-containing protein [Bacillota bacterium]